MSFRIRGLDAAPFQHLYGLSDADLAAHGGRRYTVDATPGFPDRIEMRDGTPGQTMLLLNYEHLPVANPYRSRHAIFVREGATTAYDAVDTVPDVIAIRPISLRAFDADGMMLDADLVDGRAIVPVIERMFADPAAAYLHAHNAKRGCYSGLIERA